MSTKIEQAVENFKNGFNYSHAVLAPYCKRFGLLLPWVYSIKRTFA